MMNDIDIVGQVVGGGFGDVIVRQKSGVTLEIGDLLVSEEKNDFLILQVFALDYGSQIQDRMREMRSGVNLEQGIDATFYEPEFINYVLAKIKPLARISKNDSVNMPKSLPTFFNKLRLITESDLKFLPQGDGHIFVGHIRSGTKIIDGVGVWLPAEEIFTHHILIPATTGRGKSNLVKTMLYHALNSNKIGALVLDAHDEYHGRHDLGLKDHPKADYNLKYYTAENPPPGAEMLVINLKSIKPEHFEGIVNFSEAQMAAARTYHKKYRENWISFVIKEDPGEAEGDTHKASMAVLQRKIRLALSLEPDEKGNIITGNRIFDAGTKGLRIVDQIVNHIESGRIVILDTSKMGDEAELIVGNIIASRIMSRYRRYKTDGQLKNKPVVTIVIEEAPRVIGTDVLEAHADSIYSTIAKEGRKFKIGLTAITQLSSVIPRTILANMNTKIILGNEMKQERSAIIASSSQDLSSDDKNIASLDKGEAIVSSIFVPFAMPIKIPEFKNIVDKNAVKSFDRIEV